MASIAESAESSPNRRAFEAIMNCSAQVYSTRSTVNGEGFHWEKAEGGSQSTPTSSLINVSDASRAPCTISSGTKGWWVDCEIRTEEVVTGRVRSFTSRSGQALCWSRIAEIPLQGLKSAEEFTCVMHSCWGL